MQRARNVFQRLKDERAVMQPPARKSTLRLTRLRGTVNKPRSHLAQTLHQPYLHVALHDNTGYGFLLSTEPLLCIY
jgi:hypothetical protein